MEPNKKDMHPEMKRMVDIFRKANCCGCGMPMIESESTHIVKLDRLAQWKFPVMFDLLADKQIECAMSVLCGDCMKNVQSHQVEINLAVEFNDDGKIIYHDVDHLKPAYI
jgi:hypothetical protein